MDVLGVLLMVALAVPSKVNVVVTVRLVSTLNVDVDEKLLGPNQVKDVTALLVDIDSVFVCKAHIGPELPAVTLHTKPQLVVAAPGAFAFCC